MDDPRRALEGAHQRLAVAVGDARVDRGRADVPVPEVVLDELEVCAGIQQVRGDRVTKRVGRQVFRQTRDTTVANEPRLDLAASEGSVASGKERARTVTIGLRNMRTKQLARGAEENLLAPGATLQPADEHPAARKVEVTTLQEQHLSHPQAVVVHQDEESSVAHVLDGREESPDFVLSQVARRALVWEWLDGQRGKKRDRRARRTAPVSRMAQSWSEPRREPVGAGFCW